MAYTAQDLVTKSWYLSGIVARNLQSVTGDQLRDGLFLLNALLDFKQIQTDLIPYYTYNTVYQTIAGQEKYLIANCADIQSVTFNLDIVRFAMQYVSPVDYFATSRVDNINSLPFTYTTQRVLNGTELYVYFGPMSNYQLKIYGKFFLTDVSANTDLLSVYDSSYLEYLRYALAEYMCSEYGVIFNPQSARKLQQMQAIIRYVSPPDLSLNKFTILRHHGGSVGWGFINDFVGYMPFMGR